MAIRRSGLARLGRVLAAVVLIAFPLVSSPSSAQSPAAMRPKSASLRTPDFDESVRWYQDNLGFRRIASQNLVSGRTAVLERNGFLLEISETDHPPVAQGPLANGEVQVTRVPVISILVPDVDAEVARLQAKGVEILQEPQDELAGDYRTAQIRDNGRHRIELREPLDVTGTFHANGR